MNINNVVDFPSADKEEVKESEIVESALKYAKVSHEISEGLAKVSLKTAETRVLWAIIRKTYGFQKAWDRISASQLAELTGMTPQKASSALCGLIEANIVIRKGGAYGQLKINSNSTEWVIKKKGTRCGYNPNTKLGYVNPITVKPFNPITVKPFNPITVNTIDTSIDNSIDKNIVSSSGENDDLKKSKKVPNCPHQKIVDLYHEILPEGRRVKLITDQRKASLKARWKQDARFQSIEFWTNLFACIRKSPFLLGHVAPRQGMKQFELSLDFIIQPSSFVKILEGAYEN